MTVILGLDLSLRCSGWARLDYETGDLFDAGVITTDTRDPIDVSLRSIAAAVRDVVERTVFDNECVKIAEGLAVDHIIRGSTPEVYPA